MGTREDIQKIKQAMACLCDLAGNSSNVTTTLTELFNLTLRANWTTYAPNSIQYTYDVNNNVTTAKYYSGVTLVFTQTYTYDVNNNCTSITVS